MGNFSELLTKKNIIGAAVLLLLIAAIPIGIYLVQTQQIFRSRAAVEPPIFFKSQTGGTLPIRSDEVPVTNSLVVTVNLTAPSPLPAAPSPAGANLLEPRMRAWTNNNTAAAPSGTQFIITEPGTYRLQGAVTWELLFPSESGFQEIASLQADVWTAAGRFCTTVGAGDRSVINNPVPNPERSYTLDVTVTVPLTADPECNRFNVLLRASNTNANFRNVSLVKSGTSTNLVPQALRDRNYDGTPDGQDQKWFGPGNYRLMGLVSWEPLFPPAAGFQEIASLQADIYTEGGRYLRTEPINSRTTNQNLSERSYQIDHNFTVAAGERASILERAANIKNINFRDVSLSRR